MSPNSARTVRKDLSVISSVLLLGLVALCALSGFGMDEVILVDDDVHPLIGCAMAAVAAFHALLNLGAMRKYVAKRLRVNTRSASHRAGTPPCRRPSE